jgi:hypothetical protein
MRQSRALYDPTLALISLDLFSLDRMWMAHRRRLLCHTMLHRHNLNAPRHHPSLFGAVLLENGRFACYIKEHESLWNPIFRYSFNMRIPRSDYFGNLNYMLMHRFAATRAVFCNRLDISKSSQVVCSEVLLQRSDVRAQDRRR